MLRLVYKRRDLMLHNTPLPELGREMSRLTRDALELFFDA